MTSLWYNSIYEYIVLYEQGVNYSKISKRDQFSHFYSPILSYAHRNYTQVMMENKQTQTQADDFSEEKQRKSSLFNLHFPKTPHKQQTMLATELDSNQKKANLQLLTERNMDSQKHRKPQRQKQKVLKNRFSEIKSRKNNYQCTEEDIKSQCEMWCILMEPIAQDLKEMGHSAIAQSIMNCSEVNKNLPTFHMFSSHNIGNSKHDRRGLVQDEIIVEQKRQMKQFSFQQANETGRQLNEVVYVVAASKQEKQNEQMNNFSSEQNKHHCAYYF